MRYATILATLLALLAAPAALGAPDPGAPPTPAPATAPATTPLVDLMTVGPSPILVHRWGHAALCFSWPKEPERDVCHNYGAIFPTSMASLGWQFLRGTARFMVIQQRYGDLVALYQREDRTVYLQRLPFTQAQVDELLARMAHDLREENRTYTYHHMWDNCATRLRDHLDHVSRGALRRGGDRRLGVTYRTLAQKGLAGLPALVVGTTLGFGRGLDVPVTAWASMGHPDYLRAEVEAKLGAPPEAIYHRQAPPLPSHAGAGHGTLILIALLLGLGVGLARWRRRLLRLSTALVAAVLTLLGALLWLTAAVTTVRELWLNEALLVFLPTDVLIALLSGSRRQWYLRGRLAGLGIVALLLATGVFVQPLSTAILLPALPCLALLQLPSRAAEAAPATPPPDGPAPRGKKAGRQAKA